jgi:hypothetical protein
VLSGTGYSKGEEGLCHTNVFEGTDQALSDVCVQVKIKKAFGRSWGESALVLSEIHT